MRTLKVLGIVVVGTLAAVLGAVLYVDNHAQVALNLLGHHTVEMPVFFWLYATFILGLAAGLALRLVRYFARWLRRPHQLRQSR